MLAQNLQPAEKLRKGIYLLTLQQGREQQGNGDEEREGDVKMMGAPLLQR
jgi:hypothetical protein